MDPAQLAVLLGTIVTGFIGSGSLAMWRISRLEKRMDESSKDAREDRRRIYDKLDNERKEREDDRRDFDRLAGESYEVKDILTVISVVVMILTIIVPECIIVLL